VSHTVRHDLSLHVLLLLLLLLQTTLPRSWL
jgi:hypothetical protein